MYKPVERLLLCDSISVAGRYYGYETGSNGRFKAAKAGNTYPDITG
jgi:hypothetical protein